MVTMREIQEFSDAVAREFRPEKIILFGSYAFGTPTEDSDVDLLVVMPVRGKPVEKAVEIRLRLPRTFALDLLVRTPEEVQERVSRNDFFMREVTEKGKVLYAAPDV